MEAAEGRVSSSSQAGAGRKSQVKHPSWNESDKVWIDSEYEKKLLALKCKFGNTTLEDEELGLGKKYPEGTVFAQEEIPMDRLLALRAAIDEDEPLKCADVMLHYLADVFAAPVAKVTLTDKKHKEQVLGTEWHALGGRFRWRARRVAGPPFVFAGGRRR